MLVRRSRWWVLGLTSALVLLPALGQEMPGENNPNPENALGPGKVVAKRRDVLVLPMVNATGKAALDFWRHPLSVLVCGFCPLKSVMAHGVREPNLIDAFAAGQLNPEKLEDRFTALRANGGDTVLVTSFKVEDAKWTLTGTAYDMSDPKFAAIDTITATGISAYTAVYAYVDAWSPKLGGVASDKKDTPAAGGQPDGPTPAPTPTPPPTPAPGAAPGGNPGTSAGGPGGPPGPPGAPGGAGTAPAAPTIDTTTAPIVDDYDIENWARGLSAWPYRVARLAARGDLEGAVRFHEKQLRVEPRFNVGYTDAAFAYIASGDADRGVQVQKMWTDAQPANVSDQHNLAAVYKSAGRVDESVMTYLKALTAPGGPWPEDAVGAARVMYDAGRYAEVVKGIRAFPAICSQIRDLHLILGESLVKLGDTKSAVEPLQTARAMAPYSLDGYVALADVFAKRRFWRGCLDVATEARRMMPGEPEAWMLQVKYQLLTGKTQAAKASAQQAAGQWRDHAGVQTALGEALMASNNPAGAAEAFKAAVAADPFDARARRLQARCQLQAGDGDGAAALIETALRCATPRDMAETAREGARVQFQRGDFAKALGYLKLSEEYERNHPEVTMMRSFIKLYSNDVPGAWAEFCKALEQDTNGAAATEALVVFNRAANDKKPLQPALVFLGVLQERAGRVIDARGNYRKYRLAEPQGFLCKFAEERLELTKGKTGPK